MVWRALYPIGIHFVISQIVAYTGRYFLVERAGLEAAVFYRYTMMLTGITGILALIPCLYFYRKDRFARTVGGLIPEKTASPLYLPEVLLYLIMGAFLAEYGNIFVNLLAGTTKSSAVYQESSAAIMEGKSLLVMIFWFGILVPLAEEAVFRWLIYLRLRDHLRVAASAVLSGLLFGIYHMNLIQGIYAFLLGAVFAVLMEWRGKLLVSVLLHMGANIGSLLANQYLPAIISNGSVTMLMTVNMVMFVIVVAGFWYSARACEQRGKKRMV
ncbi:MAG: CPBP family intramembrane metalloprotease [Blautia sp.]|nr:CPBP family intramembrane metalloprotease [Blautia sp.]